MLNKVILMGRICKDLELKYTTTNVAVCSFAIAVERKFQKAGQDKQTDFINCVAWRNTAEFLAKYFDKGQMINVVGSMQTRTWDDDKGVKHYATEIIVDEVNFCGDKPSGQAVQSAQGDNANDGFVPVDIDDDLPF